MSKDGIFSVSEKELISGVCVWMYAGVFQAWGELVIVFCFEIKTSN